MGFWLFWKKNRGGNDNLEGLYNNITNSFSHIKTDIEEVSHWINHFQAKHDAHDSQFSQILKRLNKIESLIDDLQSKVGNNGQVGENVLSEDEKVEESLEIKQDLWESLTESQQKICAVLAALHKEFPNQWVTLKYLAEELYPDKDYSRIRSTISQFITNLEELGLVKRKRRGKQTYVYATENNPCIQKPFLLKQTAKRLKKRSKFL